MAEAKIIITAQDNASRVLQQVRGSLDTMRSGAGLLTGAMGLLGVTSAGGMALLLKGVNDGVDALNDLRDATGASIENISALEDVAARTGTSMDTVGTSLVKFNAALNSAEPNSKAAQALKAIGLSAQELKALDPAEALRQTAVALAGFADDGNKARLTQELFGKSLKEVAPFLHDLAEQGQLVATVTTEQAQAAEKFNQQLSAMGKEAKDAARGLTAELVPALGHLLENFNKLQEKKLLGTLIKDAAFDMVGLGMLTGNASDDINSLIATRESMLKQGKKDGFSEGLKENLAEVNRLLEISRIRQAGLIDTGKEYSDQVSRRLGNKPSVGPGSTAVSSTGPAKKSQAQKDEEEFAKDRMRMLRDMATEEGKAVEAENDAHNKYIDTLARESVAQAQANQILAEQIQEIGLSTEAVGALHLARMDANIALEEQNQLTRMALGMSAEELNAYERQLDLLKQKRELTATGQIAQAAAGTKTDQDKASKAYADTLRGDLKGAFSAAFQDSTGDPLKAFGDTLERTLYDRAATGLADALATSMVGSAGGGGIGDFFSQLLPSFDGGGSTGLGARSGGLDGRGGFLSLLHPNETVLDHTKGQSAGGGGVSIVQNISIDSRSDQATIMAAMMQAKEMAKAEILRSRQRGGAFA